MVHIKRQSAPRNWPIERKGTKFVVTPMGGVKEGIPVLMLVRDILGLASNKKEVKKAAKNGKILLNQKKIIDTRNTAKLFDIISFPEANKYYKVTLTENGKFSLEEISKKDSEHKVTRINNKKLLKGKKQQINLHDGKNILQETKCKTGDSVLLNLKTNKIEKTFELKKGSEVIVFAGKHSGKKGKVKDIEEENQIVNIDTENDNINALIKQVMVTK